MKAYVYDHEQLLVAVFECSDKIEFLDKVVEAFAEHEILDWFDREQWETEAEATERIRREYVSKIGYDPFEDGEDIYNAARTLREYREEEQCES